MFNKKNKKVVFINGTLLLPLKIGARATIFKDDEIIRTSTVEAIKQVTQNNITFETQNSIYCVAFSFSPEPAAMTVNPNILYACA
jgi:hypothetical protein